VGKEWKVGRRREEIGIPPRFAFALACAILSHAPGISYLSKLLRITIPPLHERFSPGFWLFLRDFNQIQLKCLSMNHLRAKPGSSNQT
jgi:hypothetical protein